MGWVSPVSLYLKHLLQQVWICGLDQDTETPSDLNASWDNWKGSLDQLGCIAIPRRLSKFDSLIVEQSLHGFSDASEKTYGGVIYIRTLHQDAIISIILLTSKTRQG